MRLFRSLLLASVGLAMLGLTAVPSASATGPGGAQPEAAPTLRADYRLYGSLLTSIGTAPALQPTGGGSNFYTLADLGPGPAPCWPSRRGTVCRCRTCPRWSPRTTTRSPCTWSSITSAGSGGSSTSPATSATPAS